MYFGGQYLDIYLYVRGKVQCLLNSLSSCTALSHSNSITCSSLSFAHYFTPAHFVQLHTCRRETPIVVFVVVVAAGSIFIMILYSLCYYTNLESTWWIPRPIFVTHTRILVHGKTHNITMSRKLS